MPEIDGCMSNSACNFDESATVDDGLCWFVNTGCSCDAGQSAVTDHCGVCDLDSANDCTLDCALAWGGTAVVDECGVCDSDATNNNTTCVQDCALVWGGDLLGMGISECINDSTISDSLSCVTNGNTWGKIGNDECGECAGLGPDEGLDCAGDILAIINPRLIPDKFNIHNIY